jgi:hypothetical protein
MGDQGIRQRAGRMVPVDAQVPRKGDRNGPIHVADDPLGRSGRNPGAIPDAEAPAEVDSVAISLQTGRLVCAASAATALASPRVNPLELTTVLKPEQFVDPLYPGTVQHNRMRLRDGAGYVLGMERAGSVRTVGHISTGMRVIDKAECLCEK